MNPNKKSPLTILASLLIVLALFASSATAQPLSYEKCNSSNPIVCKKKNGIDFIAVCIAKTNNGATQLKTTCVNPNSKLNPKFSIEKCGCCVEESNGKQSPKYCPASSPTTAPIPAPTEAPVPSSDLLECPETSGVSMEVDLVAGLNLVNAPIGSLCTLVQVSATDEVKPVARSYDGEDWEAAAGDFASTSVLCNGGECHIESILAASKNKYLLTSFTHELTDDQIKARFLERTTFGPTKADIKAFNGNAAKWVKNQINAPMSSHRAYWRSKVTSWHPETQHIGILSTNPCNQGARYRRYAFLEKDEGRYVHVVKNEELGVVELSVGNRDEQGLLRTVVSSLQYGNWQGPIYGDVPEGV